MNARGTGEVLIARKQRYIERFGKSDVHGVIRGEIVAQFPDTPQEKIVPITAQRKIGENGERRPAALRIHVADQRVAAYDMRYLDVEQVWGVQHLPLRQ